MPGGRDRRLPALSEFSAAPPEPGAVYEAGLHRRKEPEKKAEGAYVTIPDRKEAIRYAIEHGEEGDIIILAGKGHEDYQIIKGVKYHMDERELVAEIKKEIEESKR